MPPKLAGIKKMPGKGLVGGAGSPASSASNSPRKGVPPPPGKKALIGGKGKVPAGLPGKKAPMPGKGPTLAGAKGPASPGSPGAKTKMKAPLPGGKAPLKLAPGKGKLPLKSPAPSSAASEAGTAAPPPGKAPAIKKLPMPGAKGPAPAGAAPPKLAGPPGKAPLKLAPGKGKLPLKGPMKLPLKTPSAAPSTVGDEDDGAAAAAPSPRLEGDREEAPASPIETPRDMPSSATAHLVSPGATPMPTPREGRDSEAPPPPDTTPPETPRDYAAADGGGEPAPQAPTAAPPAKDASLAAPALASATNRLDDVFAGQPPPPGHPQAGTNPPSAAGSPQQQPSPSSGAVGAPPALTPNEQAKLLQSARDSEWPSPTRSGLSNFDSAAAGGSANIGDEPAVMRMQRERIEELETQLRQVERKSFESEKFAQSLEKEASRLRETLYDREGAKVIQHISELEHENRRLRHQLEKEKDAVLYHQNAHMTTLDDLVKLRHSVDAKGDYDALKAEYDRLTEQVTRLVRANTELSLKVAEMSEDATANSCLPDTAGAPGEFIRVRLGALCASCKEMTQRWERAVSKRRGDDVVNVPGAGPRQMQSPVYADPVSSISMVSNPGASASRVAGGWRMMQMDNGQVVYHNTLTNRSQWEMPEEVRRYMRESASQQLPATATPTHRGPDAVTSPYHAGGARSGMYHAAAAAAAGGGSSHHRNEAQYDRQFASSSSAATPPPPGGAPSSPTSTPAGGFYNQPLIPSATSSGTTAATPPPAAGAAPFASSAPYGNSPAHGFSYGAPSANLQSGNFTTMHGTGHSEPSRSSPHLVASPRRQYPTSGSGVGVALFSGERTPTSAGGVRYGTASALPSASGGGLL